MDRIGTPDGLFSDGTAAAGYLDGTVVTAKWLSDMQEEACAILAAAGIALDGTKRDQIAAAVQKLIQTLAPSYAVDTGAVNACAAAFTPAVTALTDGMKLRIKVKVTNTGACTFAPNAIAAKSVWGGNHQPLQGGEMVVGGYAELEWNSALNAGNGVWLLRGCTAGAQQVAPATQSQHAAQLGQVSGVVGQARNLKMSVAAASATATLTADEIVVETALGGLRYCLASFNKTINLATTGAGGMDTGSAPASGYVALYAIYNPTTGASALLTANATAAAQPEVYSGANMPAGYTASALVSVWATDSSGKLKVGAQVDRRIAFPRIQVLATNTTQASPTLMSVSSAVPKNAKAMGGTIQVGSSTTAGANGASLTSDSAGSDYAEVGITGNVVTGNWRLGLQTPQAIYYALQGTTGIGLSVYATAYEF